MNGEVWLKRKVFKKLPVLFAIMFVLFQSFLVPLAGASWSGTAWKGDAWKGDSWSGDAWNAEGFSWEGEAWDPGKGWIQDGWEQDGWTQEGYTQDGWTGDGISGIDPVTGQPWTGDKVNGIDPATGQPWTGDEVNGIDPATGQPWTGNGINGINPATGQPWIGNGNNGINPATGQPWAGQNGSGVNPATGLPWVGIGSPGAGLSISQPGASGAAESDELDINPYDISKYVMKDLIAGQVNMTKDIASGDFSFSRPNDIYGLVLNGLKLGMGDNRALVNIYDAYGMADAGVDGVDAIKALMQYRSMSQTAINTYTSLSEPVSSIVSTASPAMSVLSKLSVATASVGTVFTAIDTVKNTGKAIEVFQNDNSTGSARTVAVTEATASLGEVLMNGGAIAAAIPGGQAIGAGLILAGAGTFFVSKGVKLAVSNWGSIKKYAGSARKKAGLFFKSIKGAFS